MLRITIPEQDVYDEDYKEIVHVNKCELLMEHSLIAISKWEMKYHKPFISEEQKNGVEMHFYFKCMTINSGIDDRVYQLLTPEDIELINRYINDPMVAIKFRKDEQNKHKKPADPMTSEMIYYYMVAAQIPFECEKWHLNRLLALIRIYGMKNEPTKKSSNPKTTAQGRAALNKARRDAIGSKG